MKVGEFKHLESTIQSKRGEEESAAWVETARVKWKAHSVRHVSTQEVENCSLG